MTKSPKHRIGEMKFDRKKERIGKKGRYLRIRTEFLRRY